MTYNALDFIGKNGFTETVANLWLNRVVSKPEMALIEAMWIAALDHEGAPSIEISVQVGELTGNMSAAVAAGVLTIGKRHGGAIQDLAKILQEGTLEPTQLVAEYLQNGQRLPGFGHRVYTKEDPRAQKLLALAKKHNFSGKHVVKVLEIESELERQKGRKLVLNIDGAMAAVLTEMGVPWHKTNAFFIFPRVAGMLAHLG